MPVVRASWQLSAGITVVLAVVWLICTLTRLPSVRVLRARKTSSSSRRSQRM